MLVSIGRRSQGLALPYPSAEVDIYSAMESCVLRPVVSASQGFREHSYTCAHALYLIRRLDVAGCQM